MSRKTLNDTRIETKLLVERLVRLQPGESIPYAELSTLIGVNDIRQMRVHLLDSARKIALRDHNIVTIRGMDFGVKRLVDEETAMSGRKDVHKARRHARRVRRKHMVIVDINQLSDAAKTFHEAAQMMASVAMQFTSEPRLKKAVEKKIGANGKIAIGDLKNLFR